MEDKKLNFNQPLLSVRRHAPAATSQRSEKRKIDNSESVIRRLPSYRAELKSGPIRNPGAVPFVWEQFPGQPKEEIKPQTRNFGRPPIAPKLPPGRQVKAGQQDCHKVTPYTIVSENQAVNVPHTSENKRQDVNVPCESHTGPSHDGNVNNFGRSKEATEEKESSDSGDSDGAYVDALDTLSRAESSFLNCSMSGLSGLGDLDVKSSGNFSTNLHTREFMMDRFLPAAKAMASETPQYEPKKQPIFQQPPQQPKKTVNQYKPSLRYGPSFADRYSHYHNNEEEESDDEYDQSQRSPAVCGLLPRFCLKSSLCLLNPVPAVSVRTRVPHSSAKKVQPRSSSAGSCCETENEFRSDRTELKSMDKIQTAELDEDSTKLRNESDQLESLSTSTYQDASLPFLKEKDVFPLPEEKADAGIQSSGLHGKGIKTFQELLDDQGSPEESDSGDPIIEKTLFVDTVHTVESPNLRSFSPETQDNTGVPSYREEELETVTKRIDQMHAIDSSLEDMKKLNRIDGDEKLPPNVHKLGDSNVLPSIYKSTKKLGMEMLQGFGEDQDFNPVSTNKENTIEVTEQEANESLEERLPKSLTLENSHQNYAGLPAPPPLPNSPSDSWLWRTLPSMSTKSSSLRSYLGASINPEIDCKKAPTNDMKWETIVKATRVQHRHLHYSEESLTTIPET